MARQAEIEGRYGDLDGPSAYRRSSSRHRQGSRRTVRHVRDSSRGQDGRQEPLRRDVHLPGSRAGLGTFMNGSAL